MAAGRQLVLPLLGILLAIAPLAGQDQRGTVMGRVFDSATDQPLSGVAVTVAERSVLTGADGRFILTGVPAGEHTLRVTQIGYRELTRTVTVAAGQTGTVQISLTPEAIQLERLLVTGYGERRAADITGSIEAVTDEEFNTGRVVSPEQLIQGKVAGLQILDTGEPGGGVAIRIRGGTSVNASNEPLFVIDGVPLPPGGGLSAGRNPLNFLNPEDIETITVLKDASATAIYGSRGANGVIIVETKSGSIRDPQFTYSGSLSASQISGRPEMLTADQLRDAVQAVAPTRVQYLGTANTDWQDAVLRSAVGQEHSLAVAGAGDDMNYRLSLGMLDQEGIVEGSLTERVSAALSTNHRLFGDRLHVQANLRGARTDDQFTPGGGLGAATVFDPTQPIMTETGFFEQTEFELAPNNPVAELELGVIDGTTYRGLASVEGEYRMPFLEALTGTARVGYDVATSERRTFMPTSMWAQQKSAFPGYVNRSNPRETTALFDAFFNYDTRLGGASDLNATAGYSYETSRGDYPFFEAYGLSSDLLGTSGIPTAEVNVSQVWVRENRLASFFGRANYTLNNRYLATVSVRRDGSSRFGPGNQWGTFPAAALAWRISEESFMDGTDWLSDLKLRASWGINGNQAIGDYLWAADYRYGDPFSQAQFGDEWVTTIRPTAVDPNIKWEETTSYNIGLDYAVLGNRVSGSLEYYFKDTDDLIFRVPVAAGTYLSNFVTTNIGSVRNQGVELSLDARLLQPRRDGGLTWDALFTAARNSNELVSINPFAGGSEQIPTGGIAGGVGSNIQVLQPGFPVNSFFVFRHRMNENGKPIRTGGDLGMYEDINGDGVINQNDRVPFESPQPDWMLSHTSHVGYGAFALSFSLRAHLGNHVYNNLASSQGYYNRLLEAGGVVNLHRSVLLYGFAAPQYFSDVYVEDASFLRMDNLTLGYKVPAGLGMREMRLFGSVQNVFTLTPYTGVDPEAGFNGIDNNIYPRSRTFTTGASFVF